MKPTNVQLHRADGTVVDCELVHQGLDENGFDQWLIAGVTYRPGDRLTMDVLPARTGITFAAAP